MAKTSFFSDGNSHSIDTQDFQGLVATLDARNAAAIASNLEAKARADAAIAITADALALANATNVSTTANKTAAEAAQASAMASKDSAATSASTSTTNAATAVLKASEAVAARDIAVAAKDTAVSARDTATGARDTAVTKAGEAAASATTASDKAALLSAQLYSFNTVYLGKFAVAPTTDGNGNAIQVGAIYENTTVGKIYAWENGAWHAYDEEAQTATSNAVLSASNAAGSATTATTQAGIATTKAGEASTSAAGALASKNAAGTSETNAKTSETNAKTSETNAATSATNAANTLASKAPLASPAFTGGASLKAVAGSAAYMEFAGNNNGVGVSSVFIGQDGANMGYLWTRANNPLTFGTNSAERMRLGGTGNLAIGMTEAGTDKLQVNAGVSITTNAAAGTNAAPLYTQLSFRGYQNNRLAAIRSFDQTGTFASGGGLEFLVNANLGADAMTSAMTIGASGRVVLGTTDNGVDKLQVAGSISSSGGAKFSATSTNAVVAISRTGTSAGTGYIGANVNLAFTTLNAGLNSAAFQVWQGAPTDSLTVSNNGNTLVGTSTEANARFVATGAAYNASATILARSGAIGDSATIGTANSSESSFVMHYSGSTNDASPAMFWTTGQAFRFAMASTKLAGGFAEVMRISAAGNLLVGSNIDNGTDRVQVLGTAVFNGPGVTGSSVKWFQQGRYPGYLYSDGGGAGITSDATTMRNGVYMDTAGNGVASYTNGAERGRYDANGNLLVGVTTGSSHTIVRSVSEGASVLGVFNSTEGVQFMAVNGGAYNAAATAIKVGKNTATGRSINAGGTINASGADYAEYMLKAEGTGELAKGAVVGVDALGNLTDKFADAVSFVLKSTDPSYVGGDTWGVGLDSEALEAARAKVDRIAFAGQVPVNVYGCKPGQFIVPSPDGVGITGVAVSEDDMTLKQYLRAVGIVQNILPDGRANVRVKVA